MNAETKVLFCGRLGKKPELKYTPKEVPICEFAVAENIPNEEKPRWHNVIIWGKQAEYCSLFLKIGSPVFVRGRISKRFYTNKKGDKKEYEEVVADLIGFSTF